MMISVVIDKRVMNNMGICPKAILYIGSPKARKKECVFSDGAHLHLYFLLLFCHIFPSMLL